MATFISTKIKPTKGFSHIVHIAFTGLLPLVVFGLVQFDLSLVALAIILLGKWRMFAVKLHYWVAHIRTNAVDIIVSIGFLAFMTSTHLFYWQVFWLVLFEVWVMVIKPRSSPVMVSLQSVVAQAVGFSAIFLVYQDMPLVVYVVAYGFIAYYSARHFLASFDEPHAQILSACWGYFAASLIWVLGHWLLFYGPVSQAALILLVVGYGVGGLYYLQETDRLSSGVRRQIMIIMITAILVILAFSNWGNKAI